MKYSNQLICLNCVGLIGGLVLGVAALGLGYVPDGKRNPDEFRTHIQQVTGDEKIQKLFIADDEDIRAITHLASVYRRTPIVLAFAIGGLMAMNLAAILTVARNNPIRSNNL